MEEGGEGYLLPVDYDPGKPQTRLSATALWGHLEHARKQGAQVIVVLDACHAGAFKLPREIERKAEENHVLFVAATSKPATAKGGRGSFTHALLEAFGDIANVDARFGAVTVQTAMIHAQGRVRQERGGQAPAAPARRREVPVALASQRNERAVHFFWQTEDLTPMCSL
jgi:uncharacterized caspase-like protein